MDLFLEDKTLWSNAERIAGIINGVNIVYSKPEEAAYLSLNSGGLSLCRGNMSVRGDFTKHINRIKPNNLFAEQVVRAAKSPSRFPTVLDATAGLGDDGFLLACAGYTVTMYEYNPVIFALLSDALARAKQDEILAPVAERINAVNGDSIIQMENGLHGDIIHLDPMFPERKKSGSVKKKLQLIQELECPCNEEKRLLTASLNSGAKKVIIKRPGGGAYLGGVKPDYSLTGKAIRYDCFIITE